MSGRTGGIRCGSDLRADARGAALHNQENCAA
jgi:hypothetical protein